MLSFLVRSFPDAADDSSKSCRGFLRECMLKKSLGPISAFAPAATVVFDEFIDLLSSQSLGLLTCEELVKCLICGLQNCESDTFLHDNTAEEFLLGEVPFTLFRSKLYMIVLCSMRPGCAGEEPCHCKSSSQRLHGDRPCATCVRPHGPRCWCRL